MMSCSSSYFLNRIEVKGFGFQSIGIQDYNGRAVQPTRSFAGVDDKGLISVPDVKFMRMPIYYDVEIVTFG